MQINPMKYILLFFNLIFFLSPIHKVINRKSSHLAAFSEFISDYYLIITFLFIIELRLTTLMI